MNFSSKKIYIEKLTTREEIINARDYMEANWNESMRSEMTRLSFVCMKYCNCKLSEL